MNCLTRRSVAMAATLVMTFGSLALSAPKTGGGDNSYFTVTGRVIKIDAKQRTLLVADRQHEKLYLATMPEGATVKILWGTYAGMTSPDFSHVRRYDLIRMRCVRRGDERLATIDSGRQATPVLAAP
ncbi:MAG TPA: hypothetical protein VJH03_18650 [Blastocatellia bacterium]|nr:hypothetical protein [Blastocatellia bacterium]